MVLLPTALLETLSDCNREVLDQIRQMSLQNLSTYQQQVHF